MPKKLLFITTRVFWPANSGRKVSLYYYCKGLHEKYGYDVYLYTFLEADQIKEVCLEEKPEFIHSVTFASNIDKITKISNILFKSLFGNFPLQCSLFYSKKNGTKINELCKKNNFDLILTDMIRLAPYYEFFKDYSCTKISDMDDLLSKRYQRTLSSEDAGDNILGQYSKFLPNFINKNILPLVKGSVLKFEIERLKNAEEYYSNLYDGVIFVSDAETEELNKRLVAPKCQTITLGVDFQYFSEKNEVNNNKNYLAFVGNFGYTPNVDSLKIIVNELLPKLKDEIKLLVIGKVSQEITSLYETDRVIFVGMVDDLRKYVKRASVFVCPIAYGSGIKTKILEAMAMGLPVVTNSIGGEGLAAINGKDYIITDDFDDMANKISELISDDNLRKYIGENGSEYVRKYHQWETVYKQFKYFNL